MEFSDEKIQEVVYVHQVERGFKAKNFIVVYEDFYVPKLKLYASSKTATVKTYMGYDGKERSYNTHDNQILDNILLPKGTIMRVDNINEIGLRESANTGDNEICFSPLRKYNKENDSIIIAQKFKTRLSNLHGMKFHKIEDVKMYMRKKKIDSVING
jgi:hypothetical protein